MVNNETKSIRFENLEALCQILECTPNEIFEYELDFNKKEIT
ncbi:MAG: helix-turn-helix domain-containing protein [Lachnospirales bacterium]